MRLRIHKAIQMIPFTDEELLAYADELLAVNRSVEIEQQLRMDVALVQRLTDLIAQQDQGEHSVGELWRRHRLSCPPRAVWAGFVDGRLGDGLSQYLRFHVETIGCRICAANLMDLERPDNSDLAERRARKIFQSSAGTMQQSSSGPRSSAE